MHQTSTEDDVRQQVQLLQHAGEIYRWTKEKDAKEAALKAHQRAENERKANVLARAQKSVVSHRKYVNTVEKYVFEVEIDRAIEASGLSTEGGIPSDQAVDCMSPVRQRRVKLLKSRVDQTLKHVGKASHIKAHITQRDRVITNLVKPLRSHLPTKKGKYERSGQFTKEQRQKRGATARPYRKTGKHIHDFQNPRNAKQRDVQLAERAKKLGVHPDVLRKSLTGK
jgi:plasmid stabilization system protein ParE